MNCYRATCSRCKESKEMSQTGKLGLCEECLGKTGQREMDMQSGKRQAPFPFFRLPFEIRRMVYILLFRTLREHGIISPDSGRIRCQDEATASAVQTLDVSLSFLQTCQQAYDEGTTVLYEANIFRFDDVPYGGIIPDLLAFPLSMMERKEVERWGPNGFFLPDFICGTSVQRCDLADMYSK